MNLPSPPPTANTLFKTRLNNVSKKKGKWVSLKSCKTTACKFENHYTTQRKVFWIDLIFCCFSLSDPKLNND